MVLSKDLKFAICFGLIIGALFSFCTMCFANDSEVVEYDVVNGLRISPANNSFVSASSNVGYFSIEPNSRYIFYNNSSAAKSIAISDDVPVVGGSLTFITNIDAGQSYTFTSSTFGYIYFDFQDHPNIDIVREDLDGLDDFVDQLVYSVGTEGLWSTFLDCVPLLVLAVLWGLGLFLIVRFVVGIVKARGGV